MPRGGFHQAFLLYEAQPNSQLPPPQKPTPVRFPSPEPSSHFGSISQHLMEIPNQLTLCHVFGVDRATRHRPAPATAAKKFPTCNWSNAWTSRGFIKVSPFLGASRRAPTSRGRFVFGVFRPIPWVVWGSRLATIFWIWKQWSNFFQTVSCFLLRKQQKGYEENKKKQTWLELHGHVSLFWFLGGFFTFCFRSFSLQREDFLPYFSVQSGKLQPFERRLSCPIDTLDAKTCRDAELIHGIIWLVNRYPYSCLL